MGILRLYYHIREWLGKDKWQSVVPNHHEDPLKMTFEEKRYLGHKYYYRAMVLPEEGSGLDTYFNNQELQFTIPNNFTIQKKITLSAGGDLIPYDCILPDVCANIWKHTGDFFSMQISCLPTWKHRPISVSLFLLRRK